MGISRPGHGDGTGSVFKTIVRFIFNRGKSGFAFHVFAQTAPLDHESANNSMKDGVVIKTAFDVGQEIVHSFGRLITIQFQHDVTLACLELNAWILRLCPGYCERKSDKNENGN